MKPTTIVVTACGAPGTAALLRALRGNGEREVRLVGTDMSDQAIGRHLCDAFHRVPRGSDPEFAETVLGVARRESASAVLPQSSFDLPGLASARERFAAEGVAVLVASPEAVSRSNDKAETYAMLDAIGVRGPAWRRVQGIEGVTRAAHELGYPDREVALKPVFSSGSRGFRVLSARPTAASNCSATAPGLPSRCGSRTLLLLGPGDETELLVMELATGKERTIDGIASDGRVLLGHPKTREAMRAGLAMYFETLDDPDLMESARRSSRSYNSTTSSTSSSSAST